MAKATIIQAPTPLPPPSTSTTTIFLSGTITGTPSWQTTLSTTLSNHPITILNPLNPLWNKTWIESSSFAPFNKQVTWELEGLERAEIVVVYFGKEGQGPISLMELGLSLGKGKKVVVGCEEGFWKRGNVEVVCERYGVDILEGLDGIVERLEGILKEFGVVNEERKSHEF